MFGVLLILNSRGEIVLSRAFRDGYNIRQLADTFRGSVVAPKMAERSPINVLDRTVMMHLRHGNLFFVLCSVMNVDAFVGFQYLQRLLQLLSNYFGVVDDQSLKENFVVVHEIIDETMDNGYPQITEADALRTYISTSGLKSDVVKKAKEAEQVTIKATGRIPWRKEGIVHRENEVFLDVIEEMNVLMSQDGEVLQREVVGRVVMQSFLSGMPECQLILNDRSMVQQAGSEARITLDDVTFHHCVRLNTFDSDRSICFIPPDGDFVLLRYRTTGASGTPPPVRLVSRHIREVSKTRMEMDFRLRFDFPPHVPLADVVVRVPCPSTTAAVKVAAPRGRAAYDAHAGAVVWKIRRLHGPCEVAMAAEVALMPVTKKSDERPWQRPPLSVAFRAPMYGASGLQLEELRVVEPRLQYKASKWMRYTTTAGQYQCRL